jgi:hypothetical protein
MWRVPFAKHTENSRVNARNAVDLPLQKHGKRKSRCKVRWINLCKILEILYAKTFQIEKAEDFAPVALFIHFQMNHLAEISRPRKTW